MENKIKVYLKDWEVSYEFPNLYMILLYCSGGDFLTLSKSMGYESYEEFEKDFEEIKDQYYDPKIRKGILTELENELETYKPIDDDCK